MTDQAQGLRELADQTRQQQLDVAPIAVVRRRQSARIIAVTSGKGGVGKTNFSTNLALMMARSGERVTLLDADLGLANVHVVLGISPRNHLEHVMRGERTLREVLYTTPQGIQLIAGGSGIAELANLDAENRTKFIDSLSELDELSDVIIIDTGAGLSHNVLAFVLAAEEVVVITTPEPTSIADAYATIKVVSQESPETKLRLVVNMATSEAEAIAVSERLTLVANQFLKANLEYLGYIPHDAMVSKAVRAQQPFTLGHPNSAAARALMQIAEELGYAPAPPAGARGFLNRLSRFFTRG